MGNLYKKKTQTNGAPTDLNRYLNVYVSFLGTSLLFNSRALVFSGSATIIQWCYVTVNDIMKMLRKFWLPLSGKLEV